MEILVEALMAVTVLVGQGFILKKMNEEFWKGLIPFYGTYLILKNACTLKYSIVLMGMVAGTCVLMSTGMLFYALQGAAIVTIACLAGALLLETAIENQYSTYCLD